MYRLAACASLLATVLAAAGCGGSTGSSTTASAPPRTSATAAAAAPRAIPRASSGAASVVSVRAGALRATMHGSTHRPRAGRPWPVSFAVTRAGAPARAAVSYQYLLAGQIVARRSHYTFTGRFSDVFTWPVSAVGYQLTLRAVIESAGTTVYLEYPIQVSR